MARRRGRFAFVKGLVLALVLASPVRAWASSASSFRSISYEVSLTPDFGAGVLTGVERLRLRSLEDGLQTLSFTANSMAVNATLDGAGPVTEAIDGGRRVFHLPRRLRRGETATLAITFAGRPRRDVVFDADQIHTGYFTCEAMICDIDRPDDRATFRLSLTLPVGDEAVAPGRLVSRASAGPGVETWTWREDRPYPSYLYGFAAGRYTRVLLKGDPAFPVLSRDETPARVQAMFADTARMAAFFEAKAGLPLPELGYTQVLVARHGDQEDAGLSLIEAASIDPILTDPHEDWILAHELAHQWWGNWVTCADWKELWLNEGLTSFMVAAYKEQRWGRAAYDREIAIGRDDMAAAKAAGLDEPLSWPGAYPSLKAKRWIAYGKSVVFLDALRTALGEDAFWRGLKAYTRANAGRSVTAADLQAAFERTSGRDLTALFRAWVFGDGPAEGSPAHP
jgi:aminopeptidase N